MKKIREYFWPVVVIIGLICLIVMAFTWGTEFIEWCKTPVTEMTLGQLVCVVIICGMLSRS